jgi:hypothetical protein
MFRDLSCRLNGIFYFRHRTSGGSRLCRLYPAKGYLTLLPLLFYLLACGTPFLQNEQIASLTFPPSTETQIIFYKKTYELDTDGTCLVREHRLLRTGDNILSAPGWFAVADNPLYRLKKFNARIIHTDGRQETYDRGVLNKASLSNAQTIFTQNVYYLSIIKELQRNDLLETVSVHKNVLLALGLDFSLNEIPYTAANISCQFQTADTSGLTYVVKNDSIKPQITAAAGMTVYAFRWNSSGLKRKRPVFQFKNRQPLLMVPGIAVKPENSSKVWTDFGNWYLDLIQPRLHYTENVKKLALDLTTNLTGEKEKLDALLRYSQKNYRYEQSYLEFGEFIPNDINTILAHGYGDCKDYSLLIYLLARSLDIPCELALCYRGRGNEFFGEVPVNQFNHMIVHYFDGSNHFWYDGTNRYGVPGLTTDDLINQPALVLQRDKSELIIIPESPLNLLKLSGEFKEIKNALVGDLTITLSGQYAINFFYLYNYFNQITMREMVCNWCQNYIHSDLRIRAVDWTVSDTEFIIRLSCEIPNALVELTDYKSFYLQKVLEQLLPLYLDEFRPEEIDYYPGFNRVAISLKMLNLSARQESADIYQVDFAYNLLPGPYHGAEKQKFIADYKSVVSQFKAKTKLYARSEK